MIQLKKYNNEDAVKRLYKKNFNQALNYERDIINLRKMIYVLYDDKTIVGYVIYKLINKSVYIDWIYAPGYGKIFMDKLEKKFKRESIKKILLNVSIDPNENIKTVMIRINFYISLQYKVYNIKFRDHYGPLLYMKKEL